MPAVVRLGDKCTGHGCFPPSTALQGSPDTFVNGKAVVRLGDKFSPHVCGKSVHAGVQASGSSTVFVNGKAVARVGDSLSCGGKNAQGSPTVFYG